MQNLTPVPILPGLNDIPEISSRVKTLEQFFLHNIYLLGASTYPKTYYVFPS